MKKYLKLMRVHHYVKNLLVFAALAFSGQFFSVDKLIAGAIGFAAFCAASSAIYIINDIKDREKDRCHPTKRNRPVASGAVTVKNACILMAFLFVVAAVASIPIYNPVAIALLGAYIILNIAYSFGLKNLPIIDIFILVSGFVIRVLYGAIITDIAVSDWLYLTVISVSFYFALGKRRNELKRVSAGETRATLKYYSEKFLDKIMYMCLGLANAFYALWAMDKKNTMNNGRMIIWTVPLVLLISMAYSMNIEGDSDGDPVEVLLRDKKLLILCAIYIIMMGLLLYV
ncbi:MAG: decaprenyl-phosphate phosphoribosyltransferase [Lachnospiraceae bacterium]|jgi:decaprenyl-phosphate phosphoribosyltransferase